MRGGERKSEFVDPICTDHEATPTNHVESKVQDTCSSSSVGVGTQGSAGTAKAEGADEALVSLEYE